MTEKRHLFTMGGGRSGEPFAPRGYRVEEVAPAEPPVFYLVWHEGDGTYENVVKARERWIVEAVMEWAQRPA